jgi:hypothetical protein
MSVWKMVDCAGLGRDTHIKSRLAAPGNFELLEVSEADMRVHILQDGTRRNAVSLESGRKQIDERRARVLWRLAGVEAGLEGQGDGGQQPDLVRAISQYEDVPCS